jgi:AcrR family transcriptional regulator
MPDPSTSLSQDRTDGDGPRTRGGWIAVGTAADRRASHSVNGTERGRRTRRKVIDGARRVFERVGYIDANIDDIVTEAGVARGSFYTYFPDKMHVFRILAAEVSQAIQEAVSLSPDAVDRDVVDRLKRSNRQYIDAYREHAVIYGLIEQLATIDPIVRADRSARRRAHVERVASSIQRWQRHGLADPAVDAETIAAQLVSMTSNFCYWWFVVGEPHDDERTVRAVTDTWIRVLDLRRRPRRSWAQSPTS